MSDPTDPRPGPAQASPTPNALFNGDAAVCTAFTEQLMALCEAYGLGAPTDVPFTLYVMTDDGRRFSAGYGCPACAIQTAMLDVVTGRIQHDRPPVQGPDGQPLAPEKGARH